MKIIIATLALLIPLCCCSLASTKEDRTCVADTEDLSDSAPKEENQDSVYYDDEKRDIDKLRSVLNHVSHINDINERVIAVSREFVGTPYVGFTLNIPPREQLYVNTSGVDCSTFVETVMALALAAGSGKPDVETFLEDLRSLRYRDGVTAGFPSRLHYVSDWALDNSRRGNFKEITSEYGGSLQNVKTIDFMSKNRQLYPALSDDSVFAAIKEIEKPLQNLRYSIIPTAQVDKAGQEFLKSGDIVAIVTDKAGLDVSHVGILRIENGIPYMTHASSKYKKVINDTMPLKTYLQRQKSPGIRVFRLSEPDKKKQ